MVEREGWAATDQRFGCKKTRTTGRERAISQPTWAHRRGGLEKVVWKGEGVKEREKLRKASAGNRNQGDPLPGIIQALTTVPVLGSDDSVQFDPVMQKK